MGRKAIDMTGVIEKNWQVLEQAPDSTKSKSIRWICKCLVCGQTKTFTGSEIRLHRIGECKCKKVIQQSTNKIKTETKTESRIKDETGKVYSHLTVENFSHSENGFAYWNCLCDCGKRVVVRGNHLRTGRIKSCGHLRSYKEEIIEKTLIDNDIDYVREYSFPDLFDKRLLRFDFCVFLQKEVLGLIEYNGQQHYEEENQYNHFGELQIHDQMKVEYCKNNNIPLLILNKDNFSEDVVLEWFYKLKERREQS